MDNSPASDRDKAGKTDIPVDGEAETGNATQQRLVTENNNKTSTTPTSSKTIFFAYYTEPTNDEFFWIIIQLKKELAGGLVKIEDHHNNEDTYTVPMRELIPLGIDLDGFVAGVEALGVYPDTESFYPGFIQDVICNELSVKEVVFKFNSDPGKKEAEIHNLNPIFVMTKATVDKSQFQCALCLKDIICNDQSQF